ncbi:hypothetical protein BCV70DRAFT_177633 [Testicularia cyperi]|uniref:Uncharacterized protein n=1 Tax=Testicularia cyperi TaxID=1882483 RepID=A0A317XKZ5_9BASI|nr:hypothetical protein BCV70DRAFT_177633 [Testicularia cyperi]
MGSQAGVEAIAPAEATNSSAPFDDSPSDADKPAQPIFAGLNSARSSLRSQSQAASQLHLLHSSTQRLYSGPAAQDGDSTNSSTSSSLNRDQYRQLIAQLRRSITHFAESSPAVQLTSGLASSIDGDPAIRNAIRRYISLLRETSGHTVALTHSIEPLQPDRTSRQKEKRRQLQQPLPLIQHMGVIRAGQNGKRPRQDLSQAIAAMGAICSMLEKLAQELGLEAFSEPVETVAAPSDAKTHSHTHTLTLGAKILVIDVEFKLAQTSSSHETPVFEPRCRLKLSYATDSDPSAPHTPRDPALGLILERDIQSIADCLFDDTSDESNASEEIATSFKRLSSNLAELISIDELCARAQPTADTEAATATAASTPSQPVDLFAIMQKLGSAVVEVASAEAKSASSETLLLEQGHGISLLHGSYPFLRTKFAHDDLTGQDYTLSLAIEPLGLPPSATSTTEKVPTPSFPLSADAAEALQRVASSTDHSRQLGFLPAPVSSASRDATKAVPLQVVAKLDPPVVVTRPTAAKLAAICRLPQKAGGGGSGTGTSATGDAASSTATWFEDVLASSWADRDTKVARTYQPRCTFSLSQTAESVRDSSSQGLVIDSLPFLHMTGHSTDDASPSNSFVSRLFAAIEILRDEVRLTELMHAAVGQDLPSSQTNTQQAEEPTLDDLLNADDASTSKAPSQIPVVLSFRHATIQSEKDGGERLMLELAFRTSVEGLTSYVLFGANLRPTSAVEPSWLLAAQATLVADGASSKTANLASDSTVTTAIARQIQGIDSLEKVVFALTQWAEQELNVRLQVPPVLDQEQREAFDPLAYEQENVHAVYETIAPHFSSTRYKPWPLIPAFLGTIPSGSVGADLGCGNGKYLPLRSALRSRSAAGCGDHVKVDSSLLTIGVDRSSNLVRLARGNIGSAGFDRAPNKQIGSPDSAAEASEHLKHCNEVAVGDALQSSLRTGVFDYAISIATIHHFSTWERRRASVQELIRIIAPVKQSEPIEPTTGETTDSDARLRNGHGPGRFMIFVWALEQKDEGKRQFEAQNPNTLKSVPTIQDPNKQKAAERLVSYSGLTATTVDASEGEEGTGADNQNDKAKVTDDQDVLVPWVLTTAAKNSKPKKERKKKDRAVKAITNDAPRHSNSGDVESGVAALALDEQAESATRTGHETAPEPPVYNRYYHVFRSGELEALVADAGKTMGAVHRNPASGQLEHIEVVREASGWERGNWWGVWRVQWRHDPGV